MKKTFLYNGGNIPGDGLKVALFADFGNGLYHSRYIAKTLVERKYPYAFHLGDVYYGGTKKQFEKYYYQPLEKMLDATKLFSMLENHEMDSGGKYYFKFLEKIKDKFSIQEQDGSYFCVRFQEHQIIGLDVNYHKMQRLKGGKKNSKKQVDWLKRRLEEGNNLNLTNILLTGGRPIPL